jgi:hypothetical protein
MLESLPVLDFVEWENQEIPISSTLPFNLTSHPSSHSVSARDLLSRIEGDLDHYGEICEKTQFPRIAGLLEKDLNSITNSQLLKILETISALINRLRDMQKDDASLLESTQHDFLKAANEVSSDSGSMGHVFVLRRNAGY